jgi:SAM-dependent methyltransferase
MKAPPVEPTVFHADRPTDLRSPSRSHRLSYIIEALPKAIGEHILALQLGDDAAVLDFGCADQPYRRLLPEAAAYVGADLPGNPFAEIDLAADGTVPVADCAFDAILSTQVLEHVGNPALYLSECYRVLRPGGRLLLSTHGIMIYHPDPVDYWRWTSAGLQRVIEAAGFEIERLEGVMGLSATGLQLFQDGIYWRLPRLLRGPFAFVVQAAIRFVDRRDGPVRRRANALVFVLVARKP